MQNGIIYNTSIKQHGIQVAWMIKKIVFQQLFYSKKIQLKSEIVGMFSNTNLQK